MLFYRIIIIIVIIIIIIIIKKITIKITSQSDNSAVRNLNWTWFDF